MPFILWICYARTVAIVLRHHTDAVVPGTLSVYAPYHPLLKRLAINGMDAPSRGNKKPPD